MRDKIPNRIEIVANVSIIVAAALGVFVLLKDHILTNRMRAESPETSVRADSRRESLVGRTVSLSGVDWANNGQTLLIVLAKGCHFCSESAGFYKQIALAAAQRKDFQIVALFPQEVSEAREYLNQIEVPISEVRQISINEIGVRGTPTLLLVDNTGVVKDAWLGRLQSDKEAEVLQKLTCRGCS
jgi:hypothetical protein